MEQLGEDDNMHEVRHTMASGKKALIAVNNDQASAIIVKYDPPGSQLPAVLKGDFTTFEKADSAIRQYLNQFKKDK